MLERLQKIIARAGVSSRRAGEELILAGRVRVNGTVVSELGAKADTSLDKIEVDGRRLIAEDQQYVVLHKPRNVVSTLSDPEGRPTVSDYLREAGARLYPVGRLDFATSGVLLATNDGDFANGLLHPRGGVPKTYVLKVSGRMMDADLERWRTGVDLDDGRTLPAEVDKLRHDGDKTWLEVTLREGKNQQIRRMGEATGFPVMRLARTSFAGITAEGLRPGEWRPLKVDELTEIREQFGVPKRVRAAAPQERRGRRPAPQRPAPHLAGGKEERAPRAAGGERGRGANAGPGRGGEPIAPRRRRIEADEPIAPPRRRIEADEPIAPPPRRTDGGAQITPPRRRIETDEPIAPL